MVEIALEGAGEGTAPDDAGAPVVSEAGIFEALPVTPDEQVE